MKPKLTLLQTNRLAALNTAEDVALNALDDYPATILHEPDKHWMAIAKTDIERGFMAARRAVCDGKRMGD